MLLPIGGPTMYNPPMIIMFDAVPSEPISRKVWVLSNAKMPFEVDSILSGDDSVKESSKKVINNGYELMLDITPPDPKGEIDYSGKFSVKLTDGSELPIEYRVFYADTGSVMSEGDQADLATAP